MKVLFIINELCAGGKERRLTQLLKSLRSSSNIQFELVVMNEEVHYRDVFDLNIKIHFLIRRTKKDLSVFAKFYNICKFYQPDLVHCWDSMTAVIAVPSCKLLKIPLINGMVVDTPVKQNIFNKDWLRAKLTFPFSKKIIGNSISGLKAYGAPENKSHCIYNGIDFSRFENLKNPNVVSNEIFGTSNHNNLFIVGMVAAFEPRKDYDTLIISALSLVKTNDSIRFILVGDGKNFSKIYDIVPNEFSKRIVFLGKRSDIESIVNIFDVGVLLTNTRVHGEGLSNSIIEYMAAGKPVIATNGGGTNELVKQNENGYLINAYDSKALIQSIEKLMEHKNITREFGSKSYEMANKNFDIKIMMQNYVNVYKKIIQENNN